MHDPLKKFVDEHRNEFDELEAPEFNMAMFKARHEVEEIPLPKRNIVFLFGTKWLAAACVVLFAGTAFLIYQQSETSENGVAAVVSKPIIKPIIPAAIKNEIVSPNEKQYEAAVKKIVLKKIDQQELEKTNWNAKLLDSSSAANRLTAILNIGQSKNISNADLDQLARTLNQDQNSNVRLAALDVLKKYSDDDHVAALLLNALDVQTDPMVQLALVALFGNSHNQKVNERLYALANNPETFEAVKDEAFSILLEQNKL
ncbi:HEAT repeat domain-containing protein [Pedobacter sp. AW1-32]|uniref:HEAT repeat domain-containing protein n=1 Tax=Pedobacter sp. AW1-32 TaxID=3383026 RepID=UPI003FEE15D6